MSSNYPNGFTSGVTIRGIPLTQMHPGKVFHVNNSGVNSKGAISDSNGNNGSFLAPFSTLVYALTQCKAGRGDIIVLGAGHSEDSAGAAGIALNVAGVAVVGLGVEEMRPKLTFSETASTITITAANMSFSNLQFEATKAEVVMGLDVSAVDGLSFDNCYFTEGAAAGTFNFVKVIDLATGCDNLSMGNCNFFGRDTNNNAQILGVAHDQFYLDNCQFYNVVAPTVTGNIQISGNVTNLEVKDCNFYSNVDGAICIAGGGATNTGVIKDTHFGSADAADFAAGAVTIAGAHCFNCMGSGDVNGYGVPCGGAQIYNNA